jgi:hypothetical protein
MKHLCYVVKCRLHKFSTVMQERNNFLPPRSVCEMKIVIFLSHLSLRASLEHNIYVQHDFLPLLLLPLRWWRVVVGGEVERTLFSVQHILLSSKKQSEPISVLIFT